MSHHQKIQKKAEKKALAWYRSLPHSSKAHLKLSEAAIIKRYWLRSVASPQELEQLSQQGH